MSSDATAPKGFDSRSCGTAALHDIHYVSSQWEPDELARLADHLAVEGREALRVVDDERLWGAWTNTVARFRDPRSEERRQLDPALARLTGLSQAGLEEGLEVVLRGVSGNSARRLFEDRSSQRDPSLVLVLLASNLPALAVQSLLPILALRRPVIVKSPSAEPLFTPFFVRCLVDEEPQLENAIAAVSWRGGDHVLEQPLLAVAGHVVAYGEDETLQDLEPRVRGELVGYGPKVSLAVVDPVADLEALAHGLARDIALFDQRGCLSIQAILCSRSAPELADALCAALRDLASTLPMGRVETAVFAGAQQLRAEADMRGLYRPELDLHAGTVVVDPVPEFRPSPGGRSVRIHPLDDLSRVAPLLAEWQGRLQGVALAGGAWELEAELEGLGVSRLVEVGELQHPDAMWHNGGRHPLVALGSSPRGAEDD